jgi:hypothetical protein
MHDHGHGQGPTVTVMGADKNYAGSRWPPSNSCVLSLANYMLFPF